MRHWIGVLVFLAVLGLMADLACANWIAYNDSVYRDGEFIADNVTTYAIGRGNVHPESGDLVQQSDGSNTGVTVTYSEFITAGSVNWAGDAATFEGGTDAAALFNDYVDPTGNISYGDAPGWYVDLTIEGLDPDGGYRFAGTAHRNGGGDYEERVTNWKVMGAESLIYACSEDAHQVAEDTVEFSTGMNDAGLVAQWTSIGPGEDGTIVIRTTHGVGKADGGLGNAHEYKGYAGGVFLLEYEGVLAVSPHDKVATTWGQVRTVH